MAVLGRYTRLLLDSYLVSSDTLTIEFELTRDQEDVPTHETPTDFIPKTATGTLTINGYISVQPNQFVLEKRLQAVFDDPDNDHYFALIPDYSATGWNPVYTGKIKTGDVQVQSAAKGIITINGSCKVTSYFRPGLGNNYDGFRAMLLYFDEALAVSETPVDTLYKDAGVVWDTSVLSVIPFSREGSADLKVNFAEADDDEGTGEQLIYLSPKDVVYSDPTALVGATDGTFTKQFVKMTVATDSGTDTVGIAAWAIGVPAA